MSEEMRQVVRSPEQVELHLPVAGPTSRILAYAIDFAVLIAIQLAIWFGMLFGLPAIVRPLWLLIQAYARGQGSKVPLERDILVALAVIWLFQLVVELGYFVFLETTTNGQSIGKRVLGLRVVQDGGFPITPYHSVVRNLLRAADNLPWSYLVGLVAMLLSADGKRLGDLAAGTVVVRLDRPPPALPLPEVPAATRDAFRFERGQIARMGATEVALVIETLRRLETLDAERAAQVLERSTAALCARIGHPPVEAGERETFLRALLAAVRLR